MRYAGMATRVVAIAVLGLGLGACGEEAKLPEAASMGGNPSLPPPTQTLIPTVNIATASSWSNGKTPKAATGLVVKSFADDLDHPRWLHVLPNGDVLVAESNAPAQTIARASEAGSWASS